MSKRQHFVISPTPLNDPRLKSTWYHRACVATGCITILITLANSILGSIKSRIWLEPILAGLAGYLLADLGTGVYHWILDNYGDASTPILGSLIVSFQRHHKWPRLITKNQFANHLHVVARSITYTMLPINLIWHDQPVMMGFVGMASGCIMFSLQFHAWAHMTKSELPPIVVALQDVGVLVSASHHAGHHRPPYNKRYCIVNGFWNRFLDEYRVFEALEMAVFVNFGLWPRSWSEPDSDWTTTKEAEASPTTYLP